MFCYYDSCLWERGLQGLCAGQTNDGISFNRSNKTQVFGWNCFKQDERCYRCGGLYFEKFTLNKQEIILLYKENYAHGNKMDIIPELLMHLEDNTSDYVLLVIENNKVLHM